MGALTDFFFDPHYLQPWKQSEAGVTYEGVILTTPCVSWRLDSNYVPCRTPEGDRRWALWLAVTTDDGDRGFCIASNSIARAFDGRATERNLRRWADLWKVGGRLSLSWRAGENGERVYRGRYESPGT
ncbi:hypothetical protein [Amycolatopsis sp. NPDC003861]